MAGKVREGGGDNLELNHEINVTPFIDVMLVLLIIFMVAAPLATVDVKVDLPASAAAPAPRPDKPLYVTLKEDLSVSVGNDTVARERLGAALDGLSEKDKETRIFLRADKNVAYGELMRVMNLLREAGYLKIALVGLETVGADQPNAAPASPAAGPAIAPEGAAQWMHLRPSTLP
ncbi:biopolymer transporter exbD [Brucella melitensis UK23/06]|uniref:TonB system transport protein ExbD n=1 Tax=Brucella melitensis TaxID=29459 RepID=UPI0002D11F3B|nr:TonB system transport protein ExbD [Brucella melitensis]ENS72321.1 biopolymer transporter exbD [Brucella melitensis UK14/06]ENS76788.1 biopolymer transporter exbD [Brucella melitensis UK23/06]